MLLKIIHFTSFFYTINFPPLLLLLLFLNNLQYYSFKFLSNSIKRVNKLFYNYKLINNLLFQKMFYI